MPKPSESVTDLLLNSGFRGSAERPINGSMEAQLADLYLQRQELQRALGTADSKAIIAMVRSLEDQLEDLYRLLEGQNAHLSSTEKPPT